ncbi:MAG: serine/threonine-protein kinase [Pseudomonadota bacterium]
MNDARDNYCLQKGTPLDSYVIDRTIGGGGFSIVYLAHDAGYGTQVAIKEYMPRKLAFRGEDGVSVHTLPDSENGDNFAHGRRMFFQEASTLANIKHPNIVNVINFFRANGTVYMVMAYEKGINLQDYIKRHGGGLSEKFIRTVFPPLLDGIKTIHGMGLLHLDIKPGNIFLRPGGNPILLDFGAVHQMQNSRKYQPTQVVTPGFAPYEQLTPGGYVGPWSDLYAIGASMRACIDGTTPPPADERRMKDTLRPAAQAFKKHYSAALLTAIDWAMEVDPLLRPQSVDQLLEAMNREDPPEEPTSRGDSFLDLLTRDITLPWSKG